MYWYLNTEENRAEIYGSMKALARDEGVKLSRLHSAFTRRKETRAEIGPHRIEKVTPKRH